MAPHEQYNPRNTLPLPPLHDSQLLPEDLYGIEEMELLRSWLKATLRCRGPEEFDKAVKSWSDDRQAVAAEMLAELRGRGLFPDRIEGDGRIRWGRVLKSALQVEMERHGARYQAIGEKIQRDRTFRLKTIEGDFA